MAKKRHEPIHGLSEREATREYVRTLRDVYQQKGLFTPIGYEIKSTLYSLGKRIENLFDHGPIPSDRPGGVYPEGLLGREEQREHARRVDKNIAQRHGYSQPTKFFGRCWLTY